MKKILSLLMITVMLSTLFCSFAVAETIVGSGSNYISGSGYVYATANSGKPSKARITVSNSTGISSGYVQVQTSAGIVCANDFWLNSGDDDYTVTISPLYRLQGGTYRIYVVMASGSADFTLELIK